MTESVGEYGRIVLMLEAFCANRGIEGDSWWSHELERSSS
jgi:hypothetical protein